jgi:hypothetical protein
MTVLKYWDVATGAYIPIVGQPGPPGARGPAGPGVAAGGAVGEILTKATVTDFDTIWAPIPPPPPSLPAGGIAGALLAKASDTDYDVAWAPIAEANIPRFLAAAVGPAAMTDYTATPVQALTISHPVKANHVYRYEGSAYGVQQTAQGNVDERFQSITTGLVIAANVPAGQFVAGSNFNLYFPTADGTATCTLQISTSAGNFRCNPNQLGLLAMDLGLNNTLLQS